MNLKPLTGKPFLRRIVLWPAAALALYAIAGFLVLPPVVRSVLVRKLSESLHRSVAIRAVRINPFALSVRVEGFSMDERAGGGSFAAFDELYANFQAASILRGGPVLREILLRSPRLVLIRNLDSSYNFSDLLGSSSGSSEGGTPLKYSLNNIRIVGGSVDFDDRPRRTRHTIRDLSIAIPFLSNLPYAVDIFVQPSFGANVNGTAVALRGRTKPYTASRESTVDLEVRNVRIPHYLEYLPAPRSFGVPSGTVDAEAVLSFSQPVGAPPVVAISGTVTLKDLAVADAKGEPVFRLPFLSAAIESLEPFSKRAKLDNVILRSPEATLVRGKTGVLNVSTLLPGGEGEPSARAGKAAPAPGGASAETTPPRAWLVEVKRAALLGASFMAVDRMPEEPARFRLAPVDVTVENLSTARNSRAQVSVEATVNRTGTVSARGAVGIDPPSADLEVDARTIGLVPFHPYLAERLTMTLTAGNLSAKGTVTVAAKGDAIRTAYAGSVHVAKLAAVDESASEDFLTWNSLHLDGVRVATNPLSVAIREVSLADFQSRIVVTPEGVLNVQRLVRRPEPAAAGVSPPDGVAAAGPSEAGPPATVSIDRVVLQGGRIRFTDYHIKPNYSANLLEVGGRLSGVSSEETRMAEVDLRGKLENHAPLEITGKVNPLRSDPFVDLKAEFRNMDLSPLTPYSGRYAGYTIEKGTLSVSVSYLITQRTLQASHNVVLDEFTFGDPVESADATTLPVRLAVGLLKDRNGEIRLDLPVGGSLDDPRFRVGGVILKIVTNLLVKAATSPFALLGGLVGRGEELSFLEFDYGNDRPDDAGRAKIESLGQALHDRPSLKLEIAGYVDRDKDGEALRRSLFDRKVRAQKLKDFAGNDGGLSLDNVVVGANEYPEYLKRAYRAEKFPKPRNVLGMVKDLPVPEMEKLMLAHIPVTDDDLRLLAQRRARAVKDSLVASNKVEPERIFLVEPRAPAPEAKDGRRESRVVFALK